MNKEQAIKLIKAHLDYGDSLDVDGLASAIVLSKAVELAEEAVVANAAVVAIEFALNSITVEGLPFLKAWHEGDFDTCRRKWPEAPEECYTGLALEDAEGDEAFTNASGLAAWATMTSEQLLAAGLKSVPMTDSDTDSESHLEARYLGKPGPVNAFNLLKAALKEDSEYAWSWHCNLAMPIMDAIHCTPEQGNKAGAALMRHIFDIDVRTFKGWVAHDKVSVDEQEAETDRALAALKAAGIEIWKVAPQDDQAVLMTLGGLKRVIRASILQSAKSQ